MATSHTYLTAVMVGSTLLATLAGRSKTCRLSWSFQLAKRNFIPPQKTCSLLRVGKAAYPGHQARAKRARCYRIVSFMKAPSTFHLKKFTTVHALPPRRQPVLGSTSPSGSTSPATKTQFNSFHTQLVAGSFGTWFSRRTLDGFLD